MALAGAITTLRSLLVFLCLATLGFDVFLIKTYIDNPTVALLWRFYVQTGITGIMLLYFFISLVVLVVQRRRLQYELASSYPPRYGGSPGFTNCHFIGSVVRALFVMVLAVGMLYVTVKALIDELRSVLILPASRDSAQYKDLNGDFSGLDPKNLLHCPASDWSQSLTLLCTFDRSIEIMGTAIAGLAVIEVLMMVVYESRTRSSWGKNDCTRGGEFDHSQHLDLENYQQKPWGSHGYHNQHYTAGHATHQQEPAGVMESVPLTDVRQ
ncbi:hypothetical protein EDD21DRAFT_350003 [Dissophora ornata]|nr:hypothetical protein BGZ58_003810 [Dissophora ornata]KAI8605428.1 hypothetical protein EDD21DRAFT_350003 [Dissophora ornata]